MTHNGTVAFACARQFEPCIHHIILSVCVCVDVRKKFTTRKYESLAHTIHQEQHEKSKETTLVTEKSNHISAWKRSMKISESKARTRERKKTNNTSCIETNRIYRQTMREANQNQWLKWNNKRKTRIVYGYVCTFWSTKDACLSVFSQQPSHLLVANNNNHNYFVQQRHAWMNEREQELRLKQTTNDERKAWETETGANTRHRQATITIKQRHIKQRNKLIIFNISLGVYIN